MQQSTQEQRSLETKNWHMEFESTEHYGSTGSEMKPFLVKLDRIVNCWTCFFFLPCASPFAGGLGAGFGVVLGRNLGTNCSHHVCKLLMVWARDVTLVGHFPLINFVTNPFTILLRHPPLEITTCLNLVACGLTQNMNNVHPKPKVSRSTHGKQ